MKRCLFLLTLLFVAGCSTTQTLSNSTSSNREPLKFAVTDEVGLEPLQETYEDFRVALEESIGTKVEFFPVENYTAATIALKQGEVDLALTGPSEYVIIRSRTNAVPITAITRPNYYSVIASAANSSIQSVADLKSKTIAMSDIGSTSGHLGPMKMLLDAGLDPQSDVEVQMLGDEGSVEAVQSGKAAAWGGSLTDYNEMLQTKGQSFQILQQSEPLPSDVIVASSSVPAETVAAIRQKMVANQDELVNAIAAHESKYKGASIIAADDAAYEPIREVYNAIGQGNFLVNP